VVAALLLVGSITAFYFVQSAMAKLLMVYAFTAAFALSVSLMTTARRVETFAATAALVRLNLEISFSVLTIVADMLLSW
jgi:hypothetical protein